MHISKRVGGATLHRIIFQINKRVLDNFILLLDGKTTILIYFISQTHTETHRFRRQGGCPLLQNSLAVQTFRKIYIKQ